MNREVGNTHKKYQMEHIEIKNVNLKMIVSLDGINSRLDNAEEKISEFENITTETIHSKCGNYILLSQCPHNLYVFNGSYMQFIIADFSFG